MDRLTPTSRAEVVAQVVVGAGLSLTVALAVVLR